MKALAVELSHRRIRVNAVAPGPIATSFIPGGDLRSPEAWAFMSQRLLIDRVGEPEDVAAMLEGMRIARELIATEPMRSVVRREIFPGPSVDDLEDDLRRRVELLYHPVGTCRMGTDDGSVVDEQLRVRGVEGLRVADASIMPLIPGGNTNAPCIMVGERAADLVKGLVPA